MSHYFIDSHAHLYLNQFDDEIDNIVEKSIDAKVLKILLPNIDVSTVSPMLETCKKFPAVFFPMIGLHPCSVGKDFEKQLEQLEKYLINERIVAIGEIGTDLYWDQTYKDQQIEAFRIQCQWARELSLPIVIHCRESLDMTIDLVEAIGGGLRGVFHCFGGTMEQARRIDDLGFKVGIGGVSTFKKSEDIRSMIALLPDHQIILETDAPYLAPHPYRGKRNESSYIPLIAKVVAESRQITIEEVAQMTTRNTIELFQLL